MTLPTTVTTVVTITAVTTMRAPHALVDCIAMMIVMVCEWNRGTKNSVCIVVINDNFVNVLQTDNTMLVRTRNQQ